MQQQGRLVAMRIHLTIKICKLYPFHSRARSFFFVCGLSSAHVNSFKIKVKSVNTFFGDGVRGRSLP
jgi:hypothetical protein